MKLWLSRNTVSEELRRRGISLLLHSTHLYKNLPQIFSDSSLFTVRKLKDVYGGGASRYLHDPYRYEKFTVGLDYINASLTFPNVELLYRRSKSEWTGDWIHLALDLSLLSREDTRFCPVSAATDLGKHVQSGVEGLRAMFADEIESHRRDSLSDNVPTHPQAEVLIHGSLPLTLIRELIVPNENVANEVRRVVAASGLPLKIEVFPQLFIWPKWLMKS